MESWSVGRIHHFGDASAVKCCCARWVFLNRSVTSWVWDTAMNQADMVSLALTGLTDHWGSQIINQYPEV